MAYHGYLGFVSSYGENLQKKSSKQIKVLEIGVDTGITFFSLINNFNLLGVCYEYTGVDIKIQNHVPLYKYTFTQRYEQNRVNLIEENSLDYLSECDQKFDIVLIDGDHNYHTVKTELSYLKKITHDNTLVICDDYTGRWADKDLYYADRPDYLDNPRVTKTLLTEKQGVATAIDEYLAENNDYKSFTLMKGEPICIVNKNNQIVTFK